MTRLGSNNSMARVFGIAAMLALLASPGEAQIKVFVFKGFFGYDHSARNTATAAMKTGLPTLLGATPAFTVDETESPTELTAAKLAGYDVLVLNNNTGLGGLQTAQRAAVLGFGQTKGVVAFHSSADFKGGTSWPEMVSYIGGSLDGHTAAMGKLRTEAATKDHPINAGLAAEAWMNDEWYGYASNPRNTPGTVVLTNIDEASMNWSGGGSMGDHPISWCKQNATGGRFFYTAMGHRDSIMQRNAYARRQLYNAILWVGKVGAVGVSATPSPSEVGMTAAPERGALRVSFPEAGEHSFMIGTMDGRRLETRRGTDARSYTVPGLRSGAVYVVSGRSRAGSFSKLVSIP